MSAPGNDHGKGGGTIRRAGPPPLRPPGVASLGGRPVGPRPLGGLVGLGQPGQVPNQAPAQNFPRPAPLGQPRTAPRPPGPGDSGMAQHPGTSVPFPGMGGPSPGPLGPTGAPLANMARPPGQRAAPFGPPGVSTPVQNGPPLVRGPPIGPGGMPGALTFRPPPPAHLSGPPAAGPPGMPQGAPPINFRQAPGMPQAIPRPGLPHGQGFPQGLPPQGFPNGPGIGGNMPPPPLAAPQFGGAARMGPPPPMRPAPGFQQPMAQAGAFDTAQARVLDQFEALSIGPPGPGQPLDMSADPASYPRPVGALAESAGAAPPPPFEGNCEARFMRLTVNAIPTQQATRARFQLPIGAIVHPLAGPQDVPEIPLSSAGIVRCKRCRTYINPFVHWIDGGRRYTCNICAMVNEVPMEYFCTLDATGKRLDAAERPELSRGSVDWVAPQEYMVRAPMPPVFFFVIDVSVTAVASGMLAAVTSAIKASLDQLPGGERTQIGFLTFDSHLHFYNLRSSLSQPQMLLVSEVSEPFVPIPDELLVNLRESRLVVDALLDSLPATFASASGVESALGPALQAAFMVVNPIGGKLLLFQAAVPSLGVGKVRNRDNAAVWGTDSEHKLRLPDDPFYKKFAAEASRVQMAIDHFCFSSEYTDLASLAALPKYTCGQLYFYPGFSVQRDGRKLTHELSHNLTRPTGWEAVMRIRCSKGLRISAFHGHFFIRCSDLLALPQVDPDKAFAVQIAHEEAVVSGSVAYMQCALLYTSSQGERRIRVHTLAVPLVTELADLYRAVDQGATATLLAKLAVEKSYSAKLEETRNAIQTKLTVALREYRALHAAAMRGGLPNTQLIFPSTMRNLPLWVLGILKCSALRGGARDVMLDERIAVGMDMMSASVPALLRLIYPELYPVSDPSGEWGRLGSDGRVMLPCTVPLSVESLNTAGAYLLDNGRIFVLWLGRSISQDFLSQVFGVEPQRDAAGLSLSVEPTRQGSDMSGRINALLSGLRAERASYAACFVVRQGSPPEVHVLPYFVEDRGQASPSYGDFIASLQKGVLAKS